MKLSYVTLYVDDLEGGRAWYAEHLGLQVAWGSDAFDHGPKTMPWGYRVATLRDPVGHTVEFFTPGRGLRQHVNEGANRQV